MIPSVLRRYGVALAAVGIVLLVRLPLDPILDTHSFLLFLPAVAFASWYGGLGPGLFTTFLSGIAGVAMFFWEGNRPGFPPGEDIDMTLSGEIIRVSLFLLVGLVISGTGEAHRKSEQRFRLLADLVPSCIWRADADGSINYANQRWYDFSGLTPQQTAGWAWTSVLHPDDVDRCVAAWKQATEQGTDYEIEVRNLRRDGEYRWLLTRAVPVRDESGNLSGWFGTATDITDQVHAREVLQEADRRKDEFIALLAHELRSPLAPIRNYLRLLRDLPPSDPRFQKAREVIERQVGHQARMLDDLLDVSRVARGQIQLQRERLDLVRLVRDAVEDRRAEIEGAGLSITIEAPEEPVPVLGDPTRLSQIVGNLLQNACKFTEPGGHVTVRVSGVGCRVSGIEPSPSDTRHPTPDTLERSDYARVTVSDTGIGMEPAMLAQMWDDFTQADRTLHRTSGGLGLGLVLVKGLTELHGGEVHAESEGPGRGTSVSVSLPLARGKGDGEGQGRQGEEAGSLPVSSPSPPPLARRVLIVEDNRDTVESLRDLLEYYGCTVQIALSGTEGLEKAQEFLPEVILCDLGLPGIDGFELARALRRIPELQEALLVAISGYGGGEMKARAHHAGFDAHLVKPIDFAELQRLLRQQ